MQFSDLFYSTKRQKWITNSLLWLPSCPHLYPNLRVHQVRHVGEISPFPFIMALKVCTESSEGWDGLHGILMFKSIALSLCSFCSCIENTTMNIIKLSFSWKLARWHNIILDSIHVFHRLMPCLKRVNICAGFTKLIFRK